MILCELNYIYRLNCAIVSKESSKVYIRSIVCQREHMYEGDSLIHYEMVKNGADVYEYIKTVCNLIFIENDLFMNRIHEIFFNIDSSTSFSGKCYTEKSKVKDMVEYSFEICALKEKSSNEYIVKILID